MTRLVRAELMKARTMRAWWVIGLGALLWTVIAFAVNALVAHFVLAEPSGDLPPGLPPDEAAAARQQAHDTWVEAHSAAGLARVAVSLYTSGQFFGLMSVMLLGALVVSGEFRHRTVAATFLAVPRRGLVVAAKLAAAVLIAAGFWLVTTVLDIVAGTLYLRSERVSNRLLHSDVTRVLLLNLAAYALWAVIGVGLGVLIRNQIGAVVTGTMAYTLSVPVTLIAFELIHNYLIRHDWVYTAQVVVPSVATDVMMTTQRAPHQAAQWVGAAVLVGYGVLAAAIGTALTRRADIA